MSPTLRLLAFCPMALAAGCGGSTVDGADATTDGAMDAVTDGPSGGDGGASDAADESVLGPDGACGCVPYWCGCGQCDPAQIACTVNPPPCGLGCASACPELQQVTCGCQSGRCVRYGVDAGSIGCVVDQDCPLGDCCAHAQGKGFCAPDGSTCCNTPCP